MLVLITCVNNSTFRSVCSDCLQENAGLCCLLMFGSIFTEHQTTLSQKEWKQTSFSYGSIDFAWGSRFLPLGLDISTNASWERYMYISGIAKSASLRTGCLYRARKFLHSYATLYLYKKNICPLMEDCCHIWAGTSAGHLSLLDRV